MSQSLCLQEQYAPANACFGCGPANQLGLRVRSFVSGDEIVAEWRAEPHHEAFEGVVSGGIIGTLLDCHCNWTAAYTLMSTQGLATPPCTVTAEYAIGLKRPTDSRLPLRLRSRAIEVGDDRVVVEGTIECGGKVTATCRGTFVAVREGHPAYHRW